MYSAEGFTPRKTSLAIMKGRRYRLPSPSGIQARSMRTSCSTASMNTGSGSGAMAMRSAEFQKALGIGVGAEQVHAAVVALVGLEAFENLLRIVQDGCGRIEREIRAGFDARAMPALRPIVADHSHVISENPTEARVHEPCRALLLGRRIRRRLDFEFQTHSLASRSRNRRDFWRRPVSPDLLARLGNIYPS